MPILKLPNDDPKQEFSFELAYQKSLTSQQRFQMMRERSQEILQRLINNGYRKPFEIVKRK
jgi:hypothetical protein